MENQPTGSTLDDDVRRALAQGRRIQDTVRNITLKALSHGELDRAALRKVTGQVVRAVSEAAAAKGPDAREAVAQAIGGVDQALAHAAQALTLSLEEAAGRAEQFTREDLAEARANLKDLEGMFVDTLRETARAGRGAAAGILEELARHAQASGTAVGRHLGEMGSLPGELAAAGRAQFTAGMSAALASGSMLARVASGVLSGIADTLAGKPGKAPPR